MSMLISKESALLFKQSSVILSTSKTEQLQIGKNLETGSRQNKTLLSFRQLCSHRRHGQDKTVLSCQCRRCEQGLRSQQDLSVN